MKSRFKVGTRGSKLAVKQTKQVVTLLQEKFPDISFELVEIVTKGDRLANHSLAAIGGQGAFVKEIEGQLLEDNIDFAVHSLKDVPTLLPEQLTLGCVLPRQNPYDCLIFKEKNQTLQSLPNQAVVGTSSLRRKAQILKLRPDLNIQPIRGNIDTRIRKLQEGDYAAIVLAMAGIIRLELADALSLEEMAAESCVPAIGQGALGIECRREDKELLALLQEVEDHHTRLEITAEREFLRNMDGSCTFPIGGFAMADSGEITLTGMVANEDGTRMLKETLTAGEPVDLGRRLAEQMLAHGAEELIELSKAKEGS